MDSSPAINAFESTETQDVTGREIYVVHNGPPRGLPGVVRRMVRLFDGAKPLDQVFDEAGVCAKKGRAVVRKLRRMGVIVPVTPLERPRHFTELEEAFFAAELEPIDECDLPHPTVGDRLRSLVHRLRGRS